MSSVNGEKEWDRKNAHSSQIGVSDWEDVMKYYETKPDIEMKQCSRNVDVSEVS